MRLYLCTLVIFLMTQVVIAQDVPTVEELGVDDTLGDIQTEFDSLPDTLDDELIPDETATQLFSYMKWFFSENAAKELAGETLAPILINLYVVLVLAFTFTLMWLTIRMLVLSWRLFLFIVSWIIKLIELIPVFE